MSTLLSLRFQLFGPFNADAIAPRLPMSFTAEEDAWLGRQIDLYDAATKSVSFGREYVLNLRRMVEGRPMDCQHLKVGGLPAAFAEHSRLL
jgi:hypothetical protein